MKFLKLVVVALIGSLSISSIYAAELRIVRYKNVVSSTIVDTLISEKLVEQEAAKRGIKDLKVSFKPLVTAISGNEAILADQLDIVWGGVQGFLGPNDTNPGLFTLLGGIYSTDMWLVCHDKSIRSLDDIKPTTRISTNNLTLSPMVINLQMMADKKFSNWKHFQSNLVLIGGPAQNQYNLIASKSGEVHCAIPGTPFQNIMTGPGKAHKVASTKDMGLPNTASAVWASTEWIKKNPVLAESFVVALQRAARMINNNPQKYVKIWHTNDGVTDNLDNVVQYVKESNSVWSMDTQYLQPWADFMYKIGLLKNKIKISDYIYREDLIKK